MVQTRSQDQKKQATSPPGPSPAQKRKAKDTDGSSEAEKAQHDTKHPRQTKVPNKGRRSVSPPSPKDTENISKVNTLFDRVLKTYGAAPLQDVVSTTWPLSQIVTAHMLNALLSSTRISHNIAMETLKCLIDEKYHDIAVLKGTTWEERTEVLTRGGYTRYREKTATFLGDLAGLIGEKYDNDASKILPTNKKGAEAQRILSARLREINGLGPVGADIFLGSIQGVFPDVTPFLDERSRKTAKAIGLGDDLDALFEAAGSSAEVMAKLEVGLTTIRLEKREGEFAK